MREKIEKLVSEFNSDERETSILYDHSDKVVLLETSHTYTARRWYSMFKDDPKVEFIQNSSTVRMKVPWDYCRKPELMIKAKYRK